MRLLILPLLVMLSGCATHDHLADRERSLAARERALENERALLKSTRETYARLAEIRATPSPAPRPVVASSSGYYPGTDTELRLDALESKQRAQEREQFAASVMRN